MKEIGSMLISNCWSVTKKTITKLFMILMSKFIDSAKADIILVLVHIYIQNFVEVSIQRNGIWVPHLSPANRYQSTSLPGSSYC